jgi:hypothetical protein
MGDVRSQETNTDVFTAMRNPNLTKFLVVQNFKSRLCWCFLMATKAFVYRMTKKKKKKKKNQRLP